MTMKLWHYLINQFLTKTKTNFRKAVKLSNYHDAVLNILTHIEQILMQNVKFYGFFNKF